ncbi:hypothetical protein F4604DRAFT_1783370 [Suillus subluteus]|nr:hypothetical protein F4604DRAFT_1783370 [Suillus subluteus]
MWHRIGLFIQAATFTLLPSRPTIHFTPLGISGSTFLVIYFNAPSVNISGLKSSTDSSLLPLSRSTLPVSQCQLNIINHLFKSSHPTIL